ncbi:MAG: MarR family transcriptional regulator [Lachnospiraceae bacterium]|nr:MarR family transcriptional regulator [Lachnospiraceae bacterium]
MALEEHNTAEESFKQFYEYIDEIKDLLSSDLWGNIFLNCSKNEVLIFWLLYRQKEVNMSEIAEYIHVPLNTATGIVGRMEKSGLIERMRSETDKRIVLIRFSEKGLAQFNRLIGELMGYAMKIMGAFSAEEMKVLETMMAKVKDVLKNEKKKEETHKKVRRIAID